MYIQSFVCVCCIVDSDFIVYFFVDGRGFRMERNEGSRADITTQYRDVEALHTLDQFYDSAYIAKVHMYVRTYVYSIILSFHFYYICLYCHYRVPWKVAYG